MAKFKSVIEDTQAEVIFLRGKAKWAQVLEPNQYGDFSINIYPSSEDLEDYTKRVEDIRDRALSEVEEKGKKINGVNEVFKEDEDGDIYIQAKLPEKNYDNKPNKIDIVDIEGNLIEDFDKLIGNGSDVVVKLYTKPYYMNSNKMVGISTKFYAIQIVRLVEYSAGGNDFQNLSSEKTSDEKQDDIAF